MAFRATTYPDRSSMASAAAVDRRRLPPGTKTVPVQQAGQSRGNFLPVEDYMAEQPGVADGQLPEVPPSVGRFIPNQPTPTPPTQAPTPIASTPKPATQAPQAPKEAGLGITPARSVSERLQDITQEGGAYLTQARQQGLQQAAQRGLSDSSIAAQAAQGAAIRAAAPIAQQEAQTEAAREEAAKQREFSRGQTALTTSANLQGQYVQATQGLLNQYAISINEIEKAQGIKTKDKNRMISNEIKRRNTDLKLLKKMYSALPTWQPNWASLPKFPSAPGLQ